MAPSPLHTASHRLFSHTPFPSLHPSLPSSHFPHAGVAFCHLTAQLAGASLSSTAYGLLVLFCFILPAPTAICVGSLHCRAIALQRRAIGSSFPASSLAGDGIIPVSSICKASAIAGFHQAYSKSLYMPAGESLHPHLLLCDPCVADTKHPSYHVLRCADSMTTPPLACAKTPPLRPTCLLFAGQAVGDCGAISHSSSCPGPPPMSHDDVHPTRLRLNSVLLSIRTASPDIVVACTFHSRVTFNQSSPCQSSAPVFYFSWPTI